MRSRIAIFEGHVPPRRLRKKSRRMGAPLFNNPRMQNYGAPLFNNPRLQGYGAPLQRDYDLLPHGYGDEYLEVPKSLQGYGRRSYRVPSRYVRSPYAYGPRDERGTPPKTKRRKYKVKHMKDTPKMKKAQARFKKAAKKCSRVAKRGRKGSYRACMRKALKKARR